MRRSAQRFHGMDAARAFALLLGVVFHAAWFYLPVPYLAPVADVRSHGLAGWLFTTSHAFRMQLFFVIAGFFARSLHHERGLRSFAQNRFKRVALPLLLGWQLLVPAWMLLATWARQVSGQSDASSSPTAILAAAYNSLRFLLPAGLGGSFGLVHLWFLYYLLVYYILILSGRELVRTLNSSRYPFQRWADGKLEHLGRSSWAPVILAIVCTPLLWAMKGWTGVDLASGFPFPPVRVLFFYALFFVLGWLLHRVAKNLKSFFAHWRLHLIVGLVMSIGVHLAHDHLRTNVLYGLQYPALTIHDVYDWPAFRASLAGEAETEPGKRAMNRLWTKMPSSIQSLLRQQAPLSVDQKQGIVLALNKIMSIPNAMREESQTGDLAKYGSGPSPPIVNREILQPYLKGVRSEATPQAAWYGLLKLAYSACYALLMCMLVFGCLGAFQSVFSGFSPIRRYVADASYWIYLVHLPVLLVLEMVIHRWDVSALVKLPLLVVVSLLVLFASYHYLVRSTLIGRVLNGRAYPFRLNPFKAIQEIPGA